MKVSHSKWKKTSNVQHQITLVVATSLLYACHQKEREKMKKKAEMMHTTNEALPGLPEIRRVRRSVEEVYECLGDLHFKRAYGMTYELFRKLVKKISPLMPQGDFTQAKVNGPISVASCVAVSSWWFSMQNCSSLWDWVQMKFSGAFGVLYPTSPHKKQKTIARLFGQKSGAGFQCCAGAIDGILIWTHKPSKKCCEEAGCADGKFYCGCKGKYGLNCQVVCDVRGRFLDMSIIYPGSTSDCLAFEGTCLWSKRLRFTSSNG
jgi:hypothetical protein